MNVLIGGVLWMLIIGWVGFTPFAFADNDEKGFEAAARLLNDGHYDEALRIYEAAFNANESPAVVSQALLLKAIAVSLYVKKPDEALTLFKQIQEQFPNSPAAEDALFHMGVLHYERKEYQTAYLKFSQYVEQYPNGFRRNSAEAWRKSINLPETQNIPDTGPEISKFRYDEVIRVLMVEGMSRLEIQTDGRLDILNSNLGKILYSADRSISFTKTPGGIAVNGQKMNFLRCWVKTSGSTLSLGKTRVRGILLISLEPDGLQAINHVPIEAYLYGLISKEMPRSWSNGALKAQAVTSRTYALYTKGKNRFMPFDVKAGTGSQVYGGFDAETPETSLAVDETQGQVLARNNRLIMAYFHSNSAGHTEDARYVWQVNLPYLKGHPDPFCKPSTENAWEYPISFAIASARLNDAGLNIGAIRSIKSNSLTPSGRVFELSFETDRGNVLLAASHFRNLIDAKQIKSTFFKVISQPDGILLKGHGHGHGVGMSQWGAHRMACAGYSYEEILKYYYPGVKLIAIGRG
jgi:stage II sporulation protein D